jgi:putative ABC transport system ATP-binding protein
VKKIAFIEVEEVVRAYRMHDIEVRALRGLSMDVQEGEMLAIIGPSGSGKTTLLNLIGGVDTPTAGTIRVETINVATLQPKERLAYRRKMVGHIFQTVNLVPTFTAAENITLPLIFSGVSQTDRRRRVEELLEIIQLTARADHRPDELSGGEQQRVAIATGLANDPPLILADEPTGDLDSESSKSIVDFLADINQQYHKTILLVTHNPLVAAECPRILRIEDGQIHGSYTPAQLESRTPIGYLDRLRSRIQEFDVELQQLEQQFKTNRIPAEKYEREHLKIQAAKHAFVDEVHRYGS